MKKGFTVTELITAMTIVGIIIAATIPIIMQTSSKSLVTLYKSAFKTTENVVSELVADLNLYGTGNFYNASSAKYFCNNFVSKVNIVGTFNCTSSTIPNAPNFNTTNGMRWYGLNNTFSTGNATISVDVNGYTKGVNASRNDILQIVIFSQGKMTTPNGNETSYLSQ